MTADSSIKSFMYALSSKSSTPGGGGAAALVGAIGTALIGMVSSITENKSKDAENSFKMQEVIEKTQEILSDFLQAADEDEMAFKNVIAAYKTPKESVGREEAIESALEGASRIPLRIMENCMKAVELCSVCYEYGAKAVASDAGCAAASCSACLKMASMNVYANTTMMKDRDRAFVINEYCDTMLNEGIEYADRIFETVKNELEQ